MNPTSSSSRIKDIFLAAHIISDREERARFLEQACGGDAELLQRVQTLLDADAGPEGFLDRPVSTEPTSGDKVGYFGDYVLLDEIARGSNGVVFRARQVSLDRVVALKMLKDGPLLTNDADVERLRAEAKSAAALDHPNILPIYEVGTCDGQPYFSMKLISGGTLQFRMAEYQQDVRKAVALMIKVARAMQHAHSQGILHRDLKPGNILIDANGEPHITDFGLARKIGMDSSLTMTGMVMGTPLYMSPEQARGGSKELTPATDIYSLGSMLYELIEGRRPFQSDDMIELIKQVAEKPAPPAQTSHRRLAAIAMKCLEKQPTARFATAGELADALEGWLSEMPSVMPARAKRPSLVGWFAALPVVLALAWAGWQFLPRKTMPSRPANGAATSEVWVTTLEDELDPPGTTGHGTSLREAVRDAAPGARISFDSSVFGGDNVITLDHARGEIQIDKNIELDGSALPEGITLRSPPGGCRRFYIGSKAEVRVKRLNFTAADIPLRGGKAGQGAAIFNEGMLILQDCRFIKNGCGANGGAIFTTGGMTMERCVFEGNETLAIGGAICVKGSTSPVRAIHCLFAGNVSHGGGGGAIIVTGRELEGKVTLEHCTFRGNRATASKNREDMRSADRGAGGAIRVDKGILEISQCIIAGNESVIAGTENISGEAKQTGPNFIGADPKDAPAGLGASVK